jgi:predicted nucleotidyltransferase
MRLSEHDRQAIRRATEEVAGAAARVFLFGSRTRDDLRGGDIDLLIELPESGADKLAVSLATAARLQRLIGQRKIDVLVTDPASLETPVIRAARAHRIRL